MAAGVFGTWQVLSAQDQLGHSRPVALHAQARVAWLDQVPSRREQLQKLSQGTVSNPYDVLIIGGGATGTGCAVDAATRCGGATCSTVQLVSWRPHDQRMERLTPGVLYALQRPEDRFD